MAIILAVAAMGTGEKWLEKCGRRNAVKNYHLIRNTKESCLKHSEAGCSTLLAPASATLYKESFLKA